MTIYTYTTFNDDPLGNSTFANGLNATGQIVGGYIPWLLQQPSSGERFALVCLG